MFTTYFNVQSHRTFPIQYIYGFHVILRVNINQLAFVMYSLLCGVRTKLLNVTLINLT